MTVAHIDGDEDRDRTMGSLSGQERSCLKWGCAEGRGCSDYWQGIERDVDEGRNERLDS